MALATAGAAGRWGACHDPEWDDGMRRHDCCGRRPDPEDLEAGQTAQRQDFVDPDPERIGLFSGRGIEGVVPVSGVETHAPRRRWRCAWKANAASSEGRRPDAGWIAMMTNDGRSENSRMPIVIGGRRGRLLKIPDSAESVGSKETDCIHALRVRCARWDPGVSSGQVRAQAAQCAADSSGLRR